jgi:parallel beta-helix repeat protein/predicted outer membrane repeat protein
MFFSSWLRKHPAKPRTSRRATSTFRPRLEVLEGRDVPSTLTVTNNLDSGPGSLRADIAAANSGDTIVFAPSLDGQTINLTSGQLVINKMLTVQGPGAGQLAISGSNTSRVFEVDGANPNVILSGLTITQGNGVGSLSGEGGAILNIGSTLTISGCTVSNNTANGGYGGAIYTTNGGVIQIVNSILSGNKVFDSNGSGEGGAVYSVLSQVSMTNCTLSNNTAGQNGGAIYESGATTMTISGCTFSGNVENGGGFGYLTPPVGNDIYNATTAQQLTVSNSVFSNNTPYSFDPIVGPWTNGGGNTGVQGGVTVVQGGKKK